MANLSMEDLDYVDSELAYYIKLNQELAELCDMSARDTPALSLALFGGGSNDLMQARMEARPPPSPAAAQVLQQCGIAIPGVKRITRLTRTNRTPLEALIAKRDEVVSLKQARQWDQSSINESIQSPSSFQRSQLFSSTPNSYMASPGGFRSSQFAGTSTPSFYYTPTTTQTAPRRTGDLIYPVSKPQLALPSP